MVKGFSSRSGKGAVMRAYEETPTTQRVLLSDMFADWIAPLIP